MTLKMIPLAALVIVSVITACKATTTPTETSSEPLLTAEAAIVIGENHVATLPRIPVSFRQPYTEGAGNPGGVGETRSPCYDGTIHTARYEAGNWVVKVGDCTFLVEDKTGIITSQ